MYVALRANFQRSVETLELSQFSKLKVYKKQHKLLSFKMLLISFLEEMQRFDALIIVATILIFKSSTRLWSKFGGWR